MIRRRSLLFGSATTALSAPFVAGPAFSWNKRQSGILAPGKYYWEVTVVLGAVGSTSGYGIAAGIANSSMALTDVVNAALNLPQAPCEFSAFFTSKVDAGAGQTPGWGYPLRAPGTSVATATGQIFRIALDTLAKKTWWQKTGAAEWNGTGGGGGGDPALGTGGNDISATGPSPVLGLIYAICGADFGDNPINNFVFPGKGTVNFGSTAFGTAAPSGFVSPASILSSFCKLDSNNKSAKITLSGGDLTFEGNTSPGPGNGDPYSIVKSNFRIAQSP